MKQRRIAGFLLLLLFFAYGCDQKPAIDDATARDAVADYYRVYYFEHVERDRISFRKNGDSCTATVERTANEKSVVDKLEVSLDGSGAYIVYDAANDRTYRYWSVEALSAYGEKYAASVTKNADGSGQISYSIP